jgi:hypothetical protein
MAAEDVDEASEASAAATLQARIRGKHEREELSRKHAAVMKIQALRRGNSVRLKLMQEGVSRFNPKSMGIAAASAISGAGTAVASAGANFIANPASVVKPLTGYNFAKKVAYSTLQSTIEKRMLSLWQTRLKFTLAADPRTPWIVRTSIHDISDMIWLNIVEVT